MNAIYLAEGLLFLYSEWSAMKPESCTLCDWLQSDSVRSLNRSLNHYLNISILLWILVTLCKKLGNLRKSRSSKSLILSDSVNLEWIHKDLVSHTPFLHVADPSLHSIIISWCMISTAVKETILDRSYLKVTG